uniref:Rhodanese domain-containing protein n=1 Tax=Opuntia streptacantha TaxID=393608 RepID=A0A7C9AC14_OPUST
MRGCGCALDYGSLSLTFRPSILAAFSLSSIFQLHGRTPRSLIASPSIAVLGSPAREFVIGYLGDFSYGRSSSSTHSASGVSLVKYDYDFIVVNFYQFVFIQDPQFEVARHLSFLEGFDIHGRIYINEQGINAQFSGPSRDALMYVEWLRQDHRFSNILVQISPSSNGHAFPRLKLRYKPTLVQFDLGVQGLPLLDPSMRPTPLSPAEWRERLQLLNSNSDVSNEDNSKSRVLLDVRNGYEWDIGHFRGAQRPEVECFQSTSFGLSDLEMVDSDPLASVDKDNTDILMYCTGGIRCDVYSAILRCCSDCVDPMRGCCCSDCKSAPRLRPVLQGHTRYQKWHIYRDSKPEEASLGL